MSHRYRPLPPALLVLLLATASPVGAAPFTSDAPPPQVVLEEVATGLGKVTAISRTPLAGDDRLFLTLREGEIVMLRDGRLLPGDFLDIRSLVGTEGEGGLLDVAFHPRYAENGFFFIHYTTKGGDTRLVRYRVSPGNPNAADRASATTFLALEQPFSNHNGGEIEFGPDGYLYLGLGDGGGAGDPFCSAQRGDTLMGKILRLDVDHAEPGRAYAIPLDNPFRNGGRFPAEAWAVGLRNPWRFSFDRETGDVYVGDVGQNHFEEIDLIPADSPGGLNFGWNSMEGSQCYSGGGACPAGTPRCRAPELVLPALEYDHGDDRCSVTAGRVYRGREVPVLDGIYLFADFCTGEVFGAQGTGDDARVFVLPDRAPRVVTFGEDAAGEVYLATLDGGLYRLAPGQTMDTVGLYDPVRSRFLLKDLHRPGGADRRIRFGRQRSGWTPLAGDWNGDGRDTIGFYDRSSTIFRLKDSLAGGLSDFVFRFGPGPGLLPITGDWDGDGKDTIGVYDPATSTFHLRNSLTTGPPDLVFVFGPPGAGWLPLAGDWDGNGQDTVGLYDPAESAFHLKGAFTPGPPDLVVVFAPNGAPGGGWFPLAGDWDGDGRDTPGLLDPAFYTFHLQSSPQGEVISFQFGRPERGWPPIAGDW